MCNRGFTRNKEKTIKGKEKELKGKSCAITNKAALLARASSAYRSVCLRTRALRSSVSSTSSMLDATPLNSTITSTERSRDDRLNVAIVFLRLPCRECFPTDNESGPHLEGLPPGIDSARRRVGGPIEQRVPKRMQQVILVCGVDWGPHNLQRDSLFYLEEVVR